MKNAQLERLRVQKLWFSFLPAKILGVLVGVFFPLFR
jgi:hypothetical protein